jgi:hypothetical protein
MTSASRSANQTKTEPIPASPSESEAETPGGASSEATPPRSAGHVGDAASVPTTSDEPAPGTSEESPVVEGLHQPDFPEPDTRT